MRRCVGSVLKWVGFGRVDVDGHGGYQISFRVVDRVEGLFLQRGSHVGTFFRRNSLKTEGAREGHAGSVAALTTIVFWQKLQDVDYGNPSVQSVVGRDFMAPGVHVIQKGHQSIQERSGMGPVGHGGDQPGLGIEDTKTIFTMESDESGRLVKFRPFGNRVQVR